MTNNKDSNNDSLNTSVQHFVLNKSLENESDSDDEQLNLIFPEKNYHVVGNQTIVKTLEESSTKV